MEFARAQLQKYGWKDGEGLGKNKTGICDALKPKLKSGREGLGHDPAEEFNYHWWEHSFNAAAQRISVKNDEKGVQVKTKKKSKPLKISTKRPDLLVEDDSSLTYGRFKKTSRLTGSCEERVAASVEEIADQTPVNNLTDEQLFVACGGRTAHKSARHGLGLSGKLARLKEQESVEINKLSKNKCKQHRSKKCKRKK